MERLCALVRNEPYTYPSLTPPTSSSLSLLVRNEPYTYPNLTPPTSSSLSLLVRNELYPNYPALTP